MTIGIGNAVADYPQQFSNPFYSQPLSLSVHFLLQHIGQIAFPLCPVKLILTILRGKGISQLLNETLLTHILTGKSLLARLSAKLHTTFHIKFSFHIISLPL